MEPTQLKGSQAELMASFLVLQWHLIHVSVYKDVVCLSPTLHGELQRQNHSSLDFII